VQQHPKRSDARPNLAQRYMGRIGVLRCDFVEFARFEKYAVMSSAAAGVKKSPPYLIGIASNKD
jgi:hypothetical protein